MINITNKEDCVGCNACVQICPKQCISMSEDSQGFRYPHVDLNLCINCHLCEKVCPVINQAAPRQPQKVYAAKNNDQAIRQASSSGGIFYALASSIIRQGGVVFGAKFDDKWQVIHSYTETLQGITQFQTSKYVQSDIGQSFLQARAFLNQGRKVLFSGTPCQIAGLKLFLRKDYGDQLLTLDIVCHGVPSPGIWRQYLENLLRQLGAKENSDFQSTLNDKMPVITGINFRDKKLGWKKYGFSVHAVVRQDDKNTDFQSTNSPSGAEIFFQPHYENLYMQGFLSDLYLRPSCYACPAKCGKSHSDITLADFWGIDKSYPQYYADNLYSLVMIKNTGGSDVLSFVKEIVKKEASYEIAVKGNPSIEMSVRKPSNYDAFWHSYAFNGLTAIKNTVRSMRPSIFERVLIRFKLLISRMFMTLYQFN